MASHISTIYNPQIGVEMEEGGVQRRVQSTPAAATEAANDAEAAMMYCRDEILPQLVSKHVLKRLMYSGLTNKLLCRIQLIITLFDPHWNSKKSSK